MRSAVLGSQTHQHFRHVFTDSLLMELFLTHVCFYHAGNNFRSAGCARTMSFALLHNRFLEDIILDESKMDHKYASGYLASALMSSTHSRLAHLSGVDLKAGCAKLG